MGCLVKVGGEWEGKVRAGERVGEKEGTMSCWAGEQLILAQEKGGE
jgi:hypothetical protein